MEFVVVGAILILSGLFPAYLIDAIRAQDPETAKNKRNNACVTFIALVTSVCLFLRG